jgi:hypothetical protein
MSTRDYKYTVALEWCGIVTVEEDDDADQDDWEDAALDAAVDEALSSPAAYDVSEYDLTRVDV